MATIDVGQDAGSSSAGNGYTIVVKTNPANDTGTIDHIDISTANFGQDMDVASLYVVSGNNLSTRDNVTITTKNPPTYDAPGDFTAFDINSGDYIGCYYNASTAGLRASTGYSGMWYANADYITCSNQAFSTADGFHYWIYATGVTGGGATVVPMRCLLGVGV